MRGLAIVFLLAGCTAGGPNAARIEGTTEPTLMPTQVDCEMPLAAFIGDSITGGLTADFYEEPWPVTASELLGWNSHNLAIPGSGYIGGSGGNFDGQVAAALALEPEIVVIAGGVGDTGRDGGPAAVEGAANDVLDALAGVPIVYVLSPMPGQSGLGLREVYGNEARRPIGDAGQTCLTGPLAPVHRHAQPRVDFGSGTAATPTGDGNADVYVQSDRIHLPQAGEEFIGRRIAQAIGDTKPCD